MSSIKNITIAIISYKRPELLNQCLKSILAQNKLSKNIIIIDNDYQKSAYKIYKLYKTKLKINYYHEPSKNISKARNLAIKNCKTQYLAFIDDDCTLSKNWSKSLLSVINVNKEIAFFQGGSELNDFKNPLILAQDQIYQKWINNNLKNKFINPQALDTKNVILNLDILNKYKIIFDVNLPIFEDADFGLKLNSFSLKGIFIPEMKVVHHEVGNLKKIIKKNYFRGKIKYILNQKWKNFDNFSPSLLNEIKNIFKKPSCFYESFFNIFFDLGFFVARNQNFKSKSNTIFMVNYLDGTANQERLLEVSNFIKKNGFETEIIDSQILFEKNINNLSGLFICPILFIKYRLSRFLFFKFRFSQLKPYLFYEEIILRGKFIKNYLNRNRAIIAISQYPKDFTCGLGRKKFKLILDIPTIYSEEIKTDNKLTTYLLKKIEKIEKKVFEQGNYVSFHWYSFLNFSKTINKKPDRNFVLNWGCHSSKNITTFNKNPKIVYMGNLNSRWINYELLESIQNESINPIDIYSYEKPDKSNYHSLKHKGFLKDINKISNYQFGLITFTDDDLRNNGFSAKHLTYLSYGLPVLCPEWRKDKLLEPATIYYSHKNFNQQIKKYSQKKNWDKKHLAAIKLAKELNWSQTLKPILPIIYKIQNEN